MSQEKITRAKEGIAHWHKDSTASSNENNWAYATECYENYVEFLRGKDYPKVAAKIFRSLVDGTAGVESDTANARSALRFHFALISKPIPVGDKPTEVESEAPTPASIVDAQILYQMTHNVAYRSQVIHKIPDDYFGDPAKNVVLSLIKEYCSEYPGVPKLDTLQASLATRMNSGAIKRNEFVIVLEELNKLEYSADKELASLDHFLDVSEAAIRSRMAELTLDQMIDIRNGNSTDKMAEMQAVMDSASSISIKQNKGLSAFDDDGIEQYCDYMEERGHQIPFDLAYLNDLTTGGAPMGSLTTIVGGTGVGKSLMMTSLATGQYMAGYDVLYVTMEMSAAETVRRMYAKMLQVPMNTIRDANRADLVSLIREKRSAYTGSVRVVHMEADVTSANDIRGYVQSLRRGEGRSPQVIYVDFLTLMSPNIKDSDQNDYSRFRSVAAQLHVMAGMTDTAVVTGAQLNRKGMTEQNPNMTQIGDSMGIIQSSDVVIVIAETRRGETYSKWEARSDKNRSGDRMSSRTLKVHRPYMMVMDANTKIDDKEYTAGNFTTNIFGDEEEVEDAPF